MTGAIKPAILVACLGVLAACGDNPVVRFPTASNSPGITATQPAAVPAGPAPAGDTYRYTCNEGIPLVVVAEPGSNGARVSYSHDSFPYRQMTEIPAASGARYTDGTNDLHLSGNQALLSYAGGGQVWDSCVRL